MCFMEREVWFEIVIRDVEHILKEQWEDERD